jgi:hypothetical protein
VFILHQLKKFQSNGDDGHLVRVSLEQACDKFLVEFIVEKKGLDPWHILKSTSCDHYGNWGLWEGDVVEVFIQGREDAEALLAPYLELNVSPNGHRFALVVQKPRQTFYTPIQLDFKSVVCHTTHDGGELWKTSINFDLPEQIKGKLFINFNCCLKCSGETEYYGLNLANTGKADFHRPEVFLPLCDIVL